MAQITVRVTLDIVVDPEAWDDTYGTGSSKAAVTRDLRAYILNEYQVHHLTESGVIREVTETHKA